MELLLSLELVSWNNCWAGCSRAVISSSNIHRIIEENFKICMPKRKNASHFLAFCSLDLGNSFITLLNQFIPLQYHSGAKVTRFLLPIYYVSIIDVEMLNSMYYLSAFRTKPAREALNTILLSEDQNSPNSNGGTTVTNFCKLYILLWYISKEKSIYYKIQLNHYDQCKCLIIQWCK